MNQILVTGISLEFESSAENTEAAKSDLISICKRLEQTHEMHGLKLSIASIAGLHILSCRDVKPIPGFTAPTVTPKKPDIVDRKIEPKKTLAISPQEAAASASVADIEEAQKFILHLNRSLSSYRLGEKIHVDGELLGPNVFIKRIVVDAFRSAGWHVQPMASSAMYVFSDAPVSEA
jgi:hypothetical protein